MASEAPSNQLIFEGHSHAISAIVELSGKIVSASHDHTLRVWDTIRGCIGEVKGHTDAINSLILLNDGRIASGSDDETVIVWRPSSRVPATPFEKEITLIGHRDRVSCLLQLVDRSGRIASGSMNNSIIIWNSSNERPLKTLKGHAGSVLCLNQHYRNNQWWLLSGSADLTIRMWSMSTSDVKVLSACHTGAVTSLMVLKDGRLASGSRDRTIKIWDLDLTSPRCLLTLSGHTGFIFCLSEGADGLLLSGSEDGTVKCWDTKQPSVPLCWSLPADSSYGVLSICQMSDGRFVTGGHDNTVKIWN